MNFFPLSLSFCPTAIQFHPNQQFQPAAKSSSTTRSTKPTNQTSKPENSKSNPYINQICFSHSSAIPRKLQSPPTQPWWTRTNSFLIIYSNWPHQLLLWVKSWFSSFPMKDRINVAWLCFSWKYQDFLQLYCSIFPWIVIVFPSIFLNLGK